MLPRRRARAARLRRPHAPPARPGAPGGTWNFTGSPAHVLAESWLGQPLAETPTSNDSRELVLRYLAAFGPSSVRDFQAWSGLVHQHDTFNDLRPELRTFRDERGVELYDLSSAPLPPADTPAPPRFLPEFDNLILSHADRTRIVADVHRPAIFLSSGRVRATFLVDGFVRGTWTIQQSRGRNGTASLVVEPFAPLTEADRSAFAAEGDHLLRFVADSASSYAVRFTQ